MATLSGLSATFPEREGKFYGVFPVFAGYGSVWSMNTQYGFYSPITHHFSPAKVIRAKELRKTMTPAERRLWKALKSEKLAGLHFRRQQAISGFIADFYCHSLRLVIEVDGSVHDDTTEYDAERDKALADLDMTIIRFRNDEISSDIDQVLHKILQTDYTSCNPSQEP